MDSSALFSTLKNIGINIMNINKKGRTFGDNKLLMKLLESIWFRPYAKNIESKLRIRIPG